VKIGEIASLELYCCATLVRLAMADLAVFLFGCRRAAASLKDALGVRSWSKPDSEEPIEVGKL
jgi:hypothetical protein